jgi:galactokinase
VTVGDGLDAQRLRSALLERYPEVRAGIDANPESLRLIRAPGRVNLIGEHTDYNEGFVLPVAIDLEIRLAAAPTRDRRAEVTLLASGERGSFDVDDPGPRRGTWLDYLAGTAWSLGAAGLPTRGFRAVLESTLPMSAGLSSSAALELAAALALLDEEGIGPGPTDSMALARLAQRAENEYVGVQCGLMDQFIVSHGRAGGAMLLDCRSLEHRAVPLPLAEHELVVCDTRAPRRLAASEYNVRRAQCEQGVAAIATLEPQVHSLRDVDRAVLGRHAAGLDPLVRRRCEHVVRENHRVLAAAAALEAGDLRTVGDLFAASHASLRDLFEVSSPELDALVEIATGVEGTAAARMTGAGFGGCTVNLVRRDALDRFRRAILDDYPRRTGLQPAIHVVRPADGAAILAPRVLDS